MKEGLVIINVSLTVYNRFHRLLMSHNSTSKFGSEMESLRGDVYIYILLNHGGSRIFGRRAVSSARKSEENEGIEGLVKNFILKIEEGGEGAT